MINYYQTINGKIVPLDHAQPSAWIHCVRPNSHELDFLVDELGFEPDFVRAALDEEESSRVEIEGNQTLVVVDFPFAEEHKETTRYTTMPMAFVVGNDMVLTVCLEEHQTLDDLVANRIKGIQTNLRTQFVLNVLLRIAKRYLIYLRQIDKISSATEKRLHQSMKNKELIQLLDLEKSLVYFTTSLKSTEVTVNKILRGRYLKMYEEDRDLIEDVLIELQQAIEMANIYTNILSGTMDAFASVISNNLNIVMKILTSVTLVMAIPNMVFSFYGMNINQLPLAGTYWFPLLVTIALCLVVGWILYKKDLFH